MTFEEITQEIEDISGFCACVYDQTNGQEMSERLTNLHVYLARSGTLQAEAQYLLDSSIAVETEKLITMDLAPSVITSLSKGRSATFQKLWKLCERMNRTITHQIEGIRTQISLLKSQR